MDFEFDKEMDSLLRQTAKGDLFATTTPAGHIDADEISMFAENALPEKGRPRVMKHLADCDKCRTILSNVIALNAEAENEAVAAVPVQETKAETAISSTEPSWFQKIFSTKNLAFGMGALALIFAVSIGFIVIQNALNQGDSQLAQANTASAEKQAPNEVEESADQDVTNANTSSDTNAETADAEATPTDSNQADSADGVTENDGLTENKEPLKDSENKQKPKTVSKNKPVDLLPERDDVKTDSIKEESPALRDKDESDDFRKKRNEVTSTEESSPPPVEKESRPTAAQPTKPKSPITSRSGTRVNRAGASDSAKRKEKKLANQISTGRQKVGGKTFTQKNGVWIDSAYKGQKTTTVKRGSTQYKNLDSGLSSVTDKIKGTVIVVWKSKAYRIQ